MKNSNYPNWLVSLEIAKELKEIGFKEKCLCYWHEYFHRIECSTSLPTWEQIFEWFRERGYHGIIAVGDESGEVNEYSYCIDYLNELSSDFEQDSHLTYEEAREALVKALIQTYKNEQL